MDDDPISATYGESCAEVYDQWFSSQEPAAIDRLAELAEGGRALELGIGTGLIALPLAERGIEVHGIDALRPWSRSCAPSRAERPSP